MSKWMLYKFIFFAFIFSVNIITHATQPLHIVIHNVGQGNCVSVNCPQENFLLIDCGSSEHNDSNRLGAPGEPPRIDFDQIREDIRNSAEDKHITIIISHLDKDHYNWIYEIFNHEEDRENIDQVIIIGERGSLGTEVGDGTDRKKTKANLLGWIISLEEEKAGTEIVKFYNDYNHPDLQAQLPPCGKNASDNDLIPTSLTANVCNRTGFTHAECGINERKNANSLVLKLNHGTCSTILPGDALGITTDDIINRIPALDHNATILLTSHHGSESHGSNSEEWIRSVDPKVAVFSAGKYPRYNHPSSVVVGRLSNVSVAPHLLNLALNHNLSYYIGDHFTPIPEKITQGIFSTFNAGDIHIRFQAEQFGIGDAIHPHLVPFAPCAS